MKRMLLHVAGAAAVALVILAGGAGPTDRGSSGATARDADVAATRGHASPTGGRYP